MEAEINKPKDVTDIVSHLKDVEYPVTGKEFIEACDNMSHVHEDQRAWVKKNILPGKTYRSPEDLSHDLDI